MTAAGRPRASRRWLPLLLVLCGLLASGCSALRGPQAAEPPAGAASDAEPGSASYALDIEAPDELRKLLEQNLDLARFRGSVGAGGVTRLELDRLIAAAPAQARTLLETQGYFEPQVEVERDDAETPRVRVTVRPGPRVRVAGVAVASEGPLHEAVEAKDAAAQRTAAELAREWPL